MNSVVYILDPFGYVRAYSEALAGNLSRRIPAKLLTTGLTQVRGPLDRGDQAVTRFFLRWTSILKRRIPWIPKVILIMLGLPEYVADLFRLRSLRQNFAIFHWQWIPLPLLTVPILWLFDIPVDVLTCHDLIPNGQIDKTRLPWSSYLSLKVARLVVFHSAKLESEALVMAPFLCGKTRVIPHGLLFEGEGRDPGLIPLRRIGMVGLLKDYKGLDDLMDAWSRVWSAAEAS